MDNAPSSAEREAQQIKAFLSTPVPPRPRRRLTGAKQWLVLLFTLILVGAIYVGMYPWAFYMGGDFHPLGMWSGWGRMHSKTAGDYFLFVTISPVTYGHETFPAWDVKGTGDFCTPKGELFRLRVRGDMPRKFYVNSMGQPISLWVENWRATLPVGAEKKPSFRLWGRWGQREILADDRGTLSKAFLPDGTLRPEKSHVLSSEVEDISVTLHEGSYGDFESACGRPH
jgi:hypothetical protein